MLLSAISKRFDTIIAQFTEFQNFCRFEKKGKSKIKRVENNKIEVTINVIKENLEIKWEKEDGI